ncbi:CBS domain-containing protein [Candidatus Woesearchaeota archaeon]|nr:CBS domain-containing protein [Candidatus Woesearchaeota archaeon]
MKTGFKVCDAMTENPITISSGASLQDCAKIMDEKHVGALLIKKNEELQGIITEQDIVRKAVAKGIDASKSKVGAYMETDMTSISPEADIFDALIKMRDLNIRHLPVIDGKKFIGLLTLKDILKIEPQLFDLLVEKFELREEERKPLSKRKPSEGICQICGKYADKVTNLDGVLMCMDCKEES